MKRRMNQKGVTLIEVVVSVIILALLALGVSATISLMSGQRGTTGARDLQAANYARETLEELKNAVSTKTAAGEHGEFLVDTDNTDAGGTVYDINNSAIAGLPVGSSLATDYSGTRQYEVWDIDEDGDGTTDFKKVTVTVTWDE